MTTLRVRDHGQTLTLTGRTVDSIVRREYGRHAWVWGENIVGPRVAGAYPVLATVIGVDAQ